MRFLSSDLYIERKAMDVRLFRPGDAAFLADIFYAAVHVVARRHYTREQVEAWAPAPPAPAFYRDRALDGRLLLVAVNDRDAPLAYGDLEADGHIDHLYCRPEVAGTGVAGAVCDRLEAAAAERGLRRLHVEASEPARRFFLRRGFAVTGRRDFAVRGVAIHNFAMEKRLAP
jgi:putative acetyltransferase